MGVRSAAGLHAIAIASTLACGCQPTASIGATAGDGSTGTTAGSTAGVPSSSEGSTTTMGAAEATTTPEDLGGGGASGSEGTWDPTTGGGQPACFPAPFDVPCIGCAKDECCDAFAACATDFNCSCTLGCIQYAGPFGCMCPPSPLVAVLFDCMMPTCNPACEPP